MSQSVSINDIKTTIHSLCTGPKNVKAWKDIASITCKSDCTIKKKMPNILINIKAAVQNLFVTVIPYIKDGCERCDITLKAQ